jgi:hypothetical protein
MATIRPSLTAAITTQVNAPAIIQPIQPPAAALAAPATANSIFVPFRKKGGLYDADSLITITSLLNQWNTYTSDHTPGECAIFSGYDAANAPANIAANVFLAMFNNNYQYVINFLSSIVADIQRAALDPLGSNCHNPLGVAANTNIIGIVNGLIIQIQKDRVLPTFYRQLNQFFPKDNQKISSVAF